MRITDSVQHLLCYCLPTVLLVAILSIAFTPTRIAAQAAPPEPEEAVDALLTTAVPPPPVMENDAYNLVNSGSIKLSWRSAKEVSNDVTREFELQYAEDSLFQSVELQYRGPDMATYISGLPGGTYFYRVREFHDNSAPSDWSKTVVVDVEHHSLSLAFVLFGVGGVVFSLTVGIVVRGAAKTDVKIDNT